MNRIYNAAAVIAAMLAGFLTVSCDKASSPDADPQVFFVRPVDSAQGDKLLTEVSMGSTIAVIGEGLAGVNRIAFNDQVSKLNPTLVTPTSIIVTVPSTMPDEVTNKMYLSTSAGKSTEYDLAVIIPSPSIQSIECDDIKSRVKYLFFACDLHDSYIIKQMFVLKWWFFLSERFFFL